VIKAPGSADISKMNSPTAPTAPTAPTKPTAHHAVAIKAPGSKLRRVEAAIASAMVAIKAPLFVQGPVEAAIAAIAADDSKTNSETYQTYCRSCGGDQSSGL
jgi:hypothetical protein